MASLTRVVNYGLQQTDAATVSAHLEKYSVKHLLAMSQAVQSVSLCMLLKVAVAQNVFQESVNVLIQIPDINIILVNHGLIVMMHA
jgi:hypothetical protein